MNPEGLYKFRNQIVRDLAWVIHSPVLMNIPSRNNIHFDNGSFLLRTKNDTGIYLKNLDDNPTVLTKFISEENSRLIGKYFENLVKFWLQNGIHPYKLIVSNLQINSGGKTRGEFDFILQDKTNGKFIHLEVAGKFYLALHNSGEWIDLFGPNGIDNLDVKLRKLLEEQMLLSEKPESVEILNGLGINGKLEKIILLKGYFFYLAGNYFAGNFVPVKNSHVNHLTGWWVRFSGIEKFLESRNSKWIVVERKNWVSRVYNPNPHEIMDSGTLYGKLKHYFKSNYYPVLISEVNTKENIPFETSRGFVVSNNWPNDLSQT